MSAAMVATAMSMSAVVAAVTVTAMVATIPAATVTMPAVVATIPVATVTMPTVIAAMSVATMTVPAAVVATMPIATMTMPMTVAAGMAHVHPRPPREERAAIRMRITRHRCQQTHRRKPDRNSTTADAHQTFSLADIGGSDPRVVSSRR